jgi:hypothetical protein
MAFIKYMSNLILIQRRCNFKSYRKGLIKHGYVCINELKILCSGYARYIVAPMNANALL